MLDCIDIKLHKLKKPPEGSFLSSDVIGTGSNRGPLPTYQVGML